MKSKYPYVSFKTDKARQTTYDEAGRKVEKTDQTEEFIFELASQVGTTCHVRPESIMAIREGSNARITGYGNFPNRSDFNELASFIENQFSFELAAARAEEAAKLKALEEAKADGQSGSGRSKTSGKGADS